MKTQMLKEPHVTEKELDILSYVNSNGGYAVCVSPKFVKQNKNFYGRVRKLENLEFILVQRYDGRPSDITITTQGMRYLNSLNEPESQSDKNFIIDLIHASSLSNNLKEKICSILS